MKSTSLHSLNADKITNPLQIGLWFLLNWINNATFPSRTGKSLNFEKFNPGLSKVELNHGMIKCSPSRVLTDIFLSTLPWDKIKAELDEVHVLDAGCGSGNMGAKLLHFLGETMSSYTGIDVSKHKNWSELQQKYSTFSFYSQSVEDKFPVESKRSNFYFSHSAIEHFDHDLTFFRQVSEAIKKNGKSTIQIHFIPSSACLKLYMLHGVRQYNFRTISYISRLFESFSYSKVFCLGGERYNKMHFDFITKPLCICKNKDLRIALAKEYYGNMISAISTDNSKEIGNPTFYALVIHSNWKTRLF